METTYTVLRVLQIGLGVITLAAGAYRWRRWFCSRTRCLIAPAVGLIVTALIAYAAAESIATGAPGGARTWLFVLAQVALLVQASTVTDRDTCRVDQSGPWAIGARTRLGDWLRARTPVLRARR